MPQSADIPEDLTGFLARHKDAKALFDALSRRHQMEYVRWIVSATKAATRQRRIEKTVEMLNEKRQRS